MSDQYPAIPVPRRSTLSADYQRDWEEYYNAVEGKPPRETLVRALNLFEAEDQRAEKEVWRLAVDIAAGEGRDTREMLRRAGPTRWRVMASDSSYAGFKRLSDSIGERDIDRLFSACCAMEELPSRYPKPMFGPSERKATAIDLVNASFALPFCQPESFPALWGWMSGNLKVGGRFSGQFFGDRDEWACVRPKSHFSRAQVERLFQGWAIEHLEEVEKEGDDATGRMKYHHVFHIVARKLAEHA